MQPATVTLTAVKIYKKGADNEKSTWYTSVLFSRNAHTDLLRNDRLRHFGCSDKKTPESGDEVGTYYFYNDDDQNREYQLILGGRALNSHFCLKAEKDTLVLTRLPMAH